MLHQINATLSRDACRVAGEVADVVRGFVVLDGQKSRPLQLEIFDMSTSRQGAELLIGLAEPPERRVAVYAAVAERLQETAPRAYQIGAEKGEVRAFKIALWRDGKQGQITIEIAASEHAPDAEVTH